MNEITNDFVRKKLQKYLLENGVKQNYIATNTGLSNCSISKFLHNERDLTEIYLKKICELISINGNKDYR